MGERRLRLWKGPVALNCSCHPLPPTGPPGLLPQRRANPASPGLLEPFAPGGTGNTCSRGLAPLHLLAGHSWGPDHSLSHPQHARAQHVRLLVDAEYTCLNPALSLLVAALATRWNSPREGGPWVWNTYQAYLKVCGALGAGGGGGPGGGIAGRGPSTLTRSCRCALPGHLRAAEAGC